MPSRIDKRLQCSSGGVRVYTVNGPKVRDRLCVEFAAGGHGYVYSYVPKGAIWIERINTHRDQRMVLAHELIEREIMKRLGWGYQRAHALANKMENCLRQGMPAVEGFYRGLVLSGCYKSDAQCHTAAYRLAGIYKAY